MRPWRPVSEMDHDELRRYSRELMGKWSVSMGQDEELQAYMREAIARMEKLGAKEIQGVADADGQD